MAITVEQSINIDRPIEEVWDYLLNHNEWRRPYVLGVRKITESGHGVGARYEDRFKAMGLEGTVVNELTEFEPPRRMSWTQPDKKGPVYVVTGSYTLESLDGRTRFTLTNRYEMPGLWRLLTPLLRRQTEREIYPTLLRQLKQAIEAR
jgi:uncharacterized protein YndB with AHSA1/START domain